jgi:signal peptidase I
MADETKPPLPSGAYKPSTGLPPVPSGAIAAGEPTAPQIPLGAPAAAPAKAPARAKTPPPPHDGFRELIETVVFVVVLVLILKTFLAEAFVIPTGSMATTLLGYHKDVTCPQCNYRFLVNASSEADPGERHPQIVTGCTCPNCQFHFELQPPRPQGAFR